MIPFMVAKQAAIFLLLLRYIVPSDHLSLVNRHHQMLQVEKDSLLAFKSTMVPYPPQSLANWNESTHVCNFTGITCGRQLLHVHHLRLGQMEIQAPLSPFLANLTSLRLLNLSGNFLTGNVPPEFSKLRHLLTLDLSSNSIQGPIPVSLSLIKPLGLLDLSENQLTGHIPPELSNLPNLVLLALSSNNLQGHIPQSLSLLKSLGYFDLGSNSLSGSIPTSIFQNCTGLYVVDLSNNSLSGEIPSEQGIHLPSLYNLNLYSNRLTGYIPMWLSNSSLEEFDIENNHISGELPTKLVSNWRKLKILHLSYTNLYSDGNNTNLEPFFLVLSNSSSELEELEMAGMGLGGHLPRRIGRNMTKLTILRLDDNKIFGPIPPGIANVWKVTLLNLSGNLLNGAIPVQIGQLRVLERLILSDNSLSGEIPEVIGNISSIGLLDLSNNRLSGNVTKHLGNLSRIDELYLDRNRLSGEIPAELGRCLSLNKLDMSYNMLTGRIPEEISGIAKIFFNLSHNLLQGPLPIGLSNMDQVEAIDLSSNNLTGIVPSQISRCVEVKLINLSRNSLQGQLPESLGNLRDLEILDVSYNSLSGEIPPSLNNCIRLTELNLSYNDFSGMIPTAGIFSSFTGESFLGNPHLCGPVFGHYCPQRKKWLRSLKFLIMVCVLASVLALLLTICCGIVLRRIRSRIFTGTREMFGSSSLVLRSNYPRITYRELVEATEDFRQDRLVGSGSYGRVYRGVLKDGTVVAVKVLQMQNGNSTRSFNRECQVLKSIRHRNLMKIITACSLPDFKALVLPFMANGSLDSRLYDGTTDLCLVRRVSILSDVAEGMAYLHHHSPVKVIHCDLKPSNVLLNDDMTGLVSDFGIARLVTSVGGGNTVGTDNAGSSTANLLRGSIGYIAPGSSKFVFDRRVAQVLSIFFS